MAKHKRVRPRYRCWTCKGQWTEAKPGPTSCPTNPEEHHYMTWLNADRMATTYRYRHTLESRDECVPSWDR